MQFDYNCWVHQIQHLLLMETQKNGVSSEIFQYSSCPFSKPANVEPTGPLQEAQRRLCAASYARVLLKAIYRD